MKRLQLFFTIIGTVFLLEGATVNAQAQDKSTKKEKKGWSKKGKGAAIGGATGIVGGAIIGGKKGAIIGGAAGTVGGAAIGRKKDKKKDPERYDQYAGKNEKD